MVSSSIDLMFIYEFMFVFKGIKNLRDSDLKKEFRL